jgi:arabinofuranan 3-O-arabinosyltransferase
LSTVVAIYAAVITVQALRNAPTSYVGDNRFELYWGPGSLLTRLTSLWDASRGIGRPRADFAPVSTACIAAMRSLGLSPAVAEHLWHGTLLLLAGVGVVAVLRELRPQLATEHVLAGLLYMFNPYSALFLVPSALYMNYALAPWIIFAGIRGHQGQDRWRSAAVVALAVFASGAADVPGLIYICVLLIPVAAYFIVVERTITVRSSAAWFVRAGVLCLLVSPATVEFLFVGSASLATRLYSTESASAVNLSSSWTESWRGLGFWVAYLRLGRGLLRPQNGAFFASVGVIFATFAAPIGSLVSLWLSRWRARLLMATFVIVSLVLMVGIFPPTSPSPYGSLLDRAYDVFPSLTALRTTYKAGAGLMIGTSCLCAVGLVVFVRAVQVRARAIAISLAVIAFLVASFPFWTGDLYSPDNRMDALPAYWKTALEYLNNQPDESRVLIIPGASNARYRWGSPGDDIFDGLLDRPHVVSTPLPFSNPEAANLLNALDSALVDERYSPGMLAPIARRLGIGTIVIRNDLDWATLQTPRPSDYATLRSDPDLIHTTSFGHPGDNVTDPADKSAPAAAERSLPPVEIYRLDGVTDTVRSLAPQTPVLLAGDGDGWLQLARAGYLRGDRPVQYTADSSPADLSTLLGKGSQLVITDSNRRRATVVSGVAFSRSHTLAAGETLGRPLANLFDRENTDTIATYPDATTITSTSTTNTLVGFEPWFRPSLAFDGDEGTAWVTGSFQNPTGRSVRIDFAHPVTVSSIEVVAAQLPGPGRNVTAASLHFSDKTSVPVDLSSGRQIATFATRTTRWLEVSIDAVSGPGFRPVGFSEVRVPGVDTREILQVPSDVFLASDASPQLASALQSAPVAYLFDRDRGQQPRDTETSLHRSFRVVGQRTFRVSGTIEAGTATTDAEIDALVGAPVGAIGSSRFRGDLSGWGGNAVDGDPTTGWKVSAKLGETLTVRLPKRRITDITITERVTADRSIASALTVIAGDSSVVVHPPPLPACSANATSGCTVTIPVSLNPVDTSSVSIRIDGVTPRAGDGLEPAPVELTEVEVGPIGLATDRTGPKVRPCTGDLLSLDGQKFGVALHDDRAVADLLAGRPANVSECGDASLTSGLHHIDTGPLVLVDDLQLATAPPAAAAPSSPTTNVLSRTPTHIRVEVATPADGAVLVNGQSFGKGWEASANGASLGPPTPVDTQNGWRLPGSGRVIVDIDYGPQRSYKVGLTVTLAAVGLCLFIALRRPPRSRT